MSWLARLFLGNGTLRPKLRGELDAEGLVLIEENLRGTVSYRRFRAPGKRFNGKVTGERMGLAVSEARIAVYCRSGRAKLIDTHFDEPRLAQVAVQAPDGEAVEFVVDYDRMDMPDVSGMITIRARTPNATEITAEITSRIGRSL